MGQHRYLPAHHNGLLQKRAELMEEIAMTRERLPSLRTI